MNKNVSKHDLIDKLVDNGNIIVSKNRRSNKFNDYFSSMWAKSLKKIQRVTINELKKSVNQTNK